MSSSHVVVIDSTARRAVVRVTPGKYLSDVLQEACDKLGLTASQYGLKNNNKHVDLSRTIRLSGLSSGAKLELVQLSRSAAVVSVALQLPESEKVSIPSGRLTDKFPSTTTLWLILRKFESGAAGGSEANLNFTGRGTPKVVGGDPGAGRLYYETPALNVMGRELSSFADLQKTLGQLGFNGGSTLLRLSFRVTDTPLEEAMTEIGQYFKSVEGEGQANSNAAGPAQANSTPATKPAGLTEAVMASGATTEPVRGTDGNTSSNDNDENTKRPSRSANSIMSEPAAMGPNHRPMSVYAPPSNATPHAARQDFNESDYEPTIDHAKSHQSRLSISAQNKRLASEAEIKAQEEAAAHKLATIKEVEIKVRYPDQSQVVSKFSATDTAAILYGFVRSMLEYGQEPFLLSYASSRGPKIIPRDDSSKSLIRDLGFDGRVLVNLIWDEKASLEARLGGTTLKKEFAAAAKEIKVEEVKPAPGVEGDRQATEAVPDKPQHSSGKGGKGGIPKWLKLPGKK